jgi:hypothetical protein
MNIVIDEQNLTAVIHDDADNPTKECILGNWNPIERRPWINVEELKSFAENDYVAPADEPVDKPAKDSDGAVM